MEPIAIGKTANRSVLGSMNDLIFQCRWRLEDLPDIDCEALAMELAEIPCGPLSYRYPRDATLEAFGAV